MRNHLVTFLTLTGVMLFGTSVSQAAVIIDPAGDFLPSYTGPLNGDLDVLRAEVFYTGVDFIFTSTSNAPIGTTPAGAFVWGINRGAGFATFPVIAPGVTFDAVVIAVPGSVAQVTDLASSVTTPLPAGSVTFNGPDLSIRVDASLLPSLGFTPQNYTVNLWPRSVLSFEDEVVSDFALDNSNAAVTATPEPSAAFLVLPALGGLLWARRRRTIREV